jgi:hypothetical protein
MSMPQSRPASSSVMHLPLRKLALCLDCDECFEIGYDACPACGSATWTPAARFLHLLAEASRATGARRKGPTKHLLVVARHRRRLYAELKRAFAGHETVQVILDRRMGERRQRKAAPELDRRRRDRRTHSAMDHQLGTIGWSLVLLDLGRSRRGSQLCADAAADAVGRR